MRAALLRVGAARARTRLGAKRDGMADEDVQINRALGVNTAHALSRRRINTTSNAAVSAAARGRAVNILTHCNAGWLATVDYGTAVGDLSGARRGRPLHVWVAETRPRNQGLLTA